MGPSIGESLLVLGVITFSLAIVALGGWLIFRPRTRRPIEPMPADSPMLPVPPQAHWMLEDNTLVRVGAVPRAVGPLEAEPEVVAEALKAAHPEPATQSGPGTAKAIPDEQPVTEKIAAPETIPVPAISAESSAAEQEPRVPIETKPVPAMAAETRPVAVVLPDVSAVEPAPDDEVTRQTQPVPAVIRGQSTDVKPETAEKTWDTHPAMGAVGADILAQTVTQPASADEHSPLPAPEAMPEPLEAPEPKQEPTLESLPESVAVDAEEPVQTSAHELATEADAPPAATAESQHEPVDVEEPKSETIEASADPEPPDEHTTAEASAELYAEPDLTQIPEEELTPAQRFELAMAAIEADRARAAQEAAMTAATSASPPEQPARGVDESPQQDAPAEHTPAVVLWHEGNPSKE